jgi:hypothetical protein
MVTQTTLEPLYKVQKTGFKVCFFKRVNVRPLRRGAGGGGGAGEGGGGGDGERAAGGGAVQVVNPVDP